MRVRPLIGMFVMSPVYSDPMGWGILDAAQTKNGKGVFQPFWAHDAPVGQYTVEAQADPERAEHIDHLHDYQARRAMLLIVKGYEKLAEHAALLQTLNLPRDRSDIDR